MQHATNMIAGFTNRPLRIASMVGFLFIIFGVVVRRWCHSLLRRRRLCAVGGINAVLDVDGWFQ